MTSTSRPCIAVTVTNDLYAYLLGQARNADVLPGVLLIEHALAFMIDCALEEGDFSRARYICHLWSGLDSTRAPEISWDDLRWYHE